MFLHIGENKMVSSLNIIAIIAIQKNEKNESIAFFKKPVCYIRKNLQRSYVICNDCIYVSPISTETLKKRTYGF